MDYASDHKNTTTIQQWDTQIADLQTVLSSRPSTEDLNDCTLRVSHLQSSLGQLPISGVDVSNRQALVQRIRQVIARHRSGATQNIVNQMNQTNNQFMSTTQQQRHSMQQQDELLANMSEGLSSLHQSSLQIGERVDMSQRLLGELEGGMDRVNNDLETQSSLTLLIKEQDGSLVKWYILIVCLFALLVFQLLMKL